MRINTLIVALCAMLGLGGAFEKANAQIVVAVGIAPPALPVYVQPEIPGPDYIWLRATGCGMAIFQNITGYRVRGCSRRVWACCGLLDIGAGVVVSTLGTPAIGVRPSVSTAVCPTGSAIQEWASRAATGPAGPSTITGQLQISVTLQSSTMSTTNRLSITTQPTLAITEVMAA